MLYLTTLRYLNLIKVDVKIDRIEFEAKLLQYYFKYYYYIKLHILS